MKFGKQIQAEQVPGWSAYYLDYKFLKKIISSLSGKRPAAEAASLALGVRPGDILSSPTPASRISSQWDSRRADTIAASPNVPSILSTFAQEEDKGADFQAHKVAFFFKLERELEKINNFYLQKEAELKLRLETLLSQRRAAASRVLPDNSDDNVQNHVEWNAVEEGFRQLHRDLGKLQHFVEINATGFRKILKKWDKRSKSTTKELYLARQVDVQPVFDRQLISELSDIVAACLLDVTDLSSGLKVEKPAVNDLIFTHQMNIEKSTHAGPFHALERNLKSAVSASDESSIREVIKYMDTLASQQWGSTNVTRILWKAVIDAPPDLADFMLSCPAQPFNFHFIDDVSGRTCLHEAALAVAPRLVDICLREGVQRGKLDVYGRNAIHYACLAAVSPGTDADRASASICRKLIEEGVDPNQLDLDNYSPLVYATLRGSVECVRVLLEVGGVSAAPITTSSDLNPLSLASQAGHVDVALLLLHHGARNVTNTNGEYPIHLAARDGHADICRLLVKYEGWDVPDKYNEWTPLFHAARYGRVACLHVLIEAGARVDAVDEVGNTAVYYAGWYGHRDSVAVLLEARSRLPAARQATSPLPISPLSQSGGVVDMELDFIPSLSLPPPIMPHRVYGHNYLDKTCLIQVTIGHMSSHYGDASYGPPVQLHPRLTSSQLGGLYTQASPLLKLVLTGNPDATLAPFSVPLPMKDENYVFTFQVPSVKQLSLEFSLYPNFGTKTIGRAIAIPAMLQGLDNSHPLVLPIVDQRLHVIGEVSFEVNMVKPFRGVTLEVGGAVETYWKSMAMPVSLPSEKASRRIPPVLSLGSIGSATTSPAFSAVAAGGHALTVSSVVGQYLYVVVQVTRDLQPVAYAHWQLPQSGLDLGVADVTLAQFEAMSLAQGRNVNFAERSMTTLTEWRAILSEAMVPLDALLRGLPASTGVCLELAYAPSMSAQQSPARPRQDLNSFVDCVLRTVYHTLDGPGRRRLVFTSFSPDACAALNWKQPNYPVFFASHCGGKSGVSPSAAAASSQTIRDRRLTTLAAAVEFAKANNLLGILVEGELLAHVPSLVQGVKDTGLLVGAFGAAEHASFLTSSGTDMPGVDAILADGILNYMDHSMRALV